ncbi:hypothetical protein GUITHDRAFT_151208 [Guillardia theta CCMP2712]|uniref:SGNH hydrolase-type esterase domain-containing protein n=1 Tax=Guillardia theta (strain CCMP2712) TaxID=905079 RepID=L1JR19_GUITC|nr:hypothetical protein GUITHDRAFT_151208 [Guillardia theta CCMP2712]EKX50640.1 hypothetical protein GUITHDRAFT_151208 [Guillardia theta CCMP2712]|eukprot:XP_005837620.1 hypothetical protein GUITHDRAFT_151208 [Guillardia theta CCMP2712]
MAMVARGRRQMLLFGDSITQFGSKVDPLGWASLLQDLYVAQKRSVDIVNRGFSGYNSRWAKLILPAIIEEHKSNPPVLATILLGANDAAVESCRQHVPLPEYIQNMEELVKMMRAGWPESVIVLISPPPVDAATWDANKGGPGLGQRELEHVEKYARACSELAARMSCPVLDLFNILHKEKGWEAHFSDGLHLSASGNQILFDALIELINKQFPSLSSESLPMDFKYHGDIPEDDPASVLGDR